MVEQCPRRSPIAGGLSPVGAAADVSALPTRRSPETRPSREPSRAALSDGTKAESITRFSAHERRLPLRSVACTSTTTDRKSTRLNSSAAYRSEEHTSEL